VHTSALFAPPIPGAFAQFIKSSPLLENINRRCPHLLEQEA